ncbi:MAG TPA: hypothetical protein VGX78_15955 [Pirellulales bacterium]|nr:hypothetical protein [Pirellulales bacterium]
MPRTLPPEIVVTVTPDGFHYRLPRPQRGPARFVGCLPIAFGSLTAGMGCVFVAFAVTAIPNLSWAAILVACLFLLVPLTFILGGLALVFIGCWMLAGHQGISLTKHHIRSSSCVGPARWSGRRSRSRLKQFTVVRRDRAGDLLQAECEGSKPLRLALGYPADWLAVLADDLKRKCRELPAKTLDEGQAAVVGVAEESAAPNDIRDRPEPPINCRAILEKQGDGLTLVLPLEGVWQATSKFIVLWTFCWCGMVSLITAAFGRALLLGEFHDKHGHPVSPVGPFLMLVPFWLIGTGFLLSILHRGRRQVALTLNGEQLLVVHSGLLRTRRLEMPRGDVVELFVVCDRRATIGEGERNPYFPWQIDLRIVSRDGSHVNVVTCRKGDPRKAELEWMATVLRRALGIRKKKRQ